MEFLYSLNRLNVATSRARCACILVASPRLLEPECRTPRQMQLANALCRYRELATTVVRVRLPPRESGRPRLMPSFCEASILNSPNEHPSRRWELESGLPTERIVDQLRRVSFITPQPAPQEAESQTGLHLRRAKKADPLQ